jgi:hypothetical protein
MYEVVRQVWERTHDIWGEGVEHVSLENEEGCITWRARTWRRQGGLDYAGAFKEVAPGKWAAIVRAGSLTKTTVLEIDPLVEVVRIRISKRLPRATGRIAEFISNGGLTSE